MVVASLWIFFSDRTMGMLVSDPDRLVRWSIYKGWFYVAFTALMLYAVLRVVFERLRNACADFQESENRFRSLVEATSDWIWQVDENSIYTYASPHVRELLGYEPEEVLGRTPFDFMPPDEAQRAASVFGPLAARREAIHALENINRTKDGRLVVLETSGVPLFDADGTFRGYRGIDRDVTGRKAQDARLQLLSTAIDQSDQSVVITDAAGVIEYVNAAFESVTGYSRAEAIGHNPRILKSGLHDAAFYKEMWAQIDAGRSWKGRVRNKRKDGSIYVEDATISPVRDDKGLTFAYVGVKRDVTRELQLDEQYRQSQKMEAVGRLAGGIAHDFNNILQTILGFCGVLLAELKEPLSARQDVLDIQQAAKRAADLTRQLLTFSRKQDAEFAVLDVNKVVASQQRMLARLLDSNIEVSTHLDPTLKPVRADHGKVGQVIMNLVVNARDAIHGRGQIVIGTKNVVLTEADSFAMPESRPGEFVCLSVADTGSGMQGEVRQHIFEPFFTTKEPGKGTGLGLAVIYGIVQQHQGWVSVSSVPGEGSEFRVYFPACEDATPDTAGSAPPVGADVRGKDRLVMLVGVDPEDDIRISAILGEAGCQVVSAASAKQAEEVFARFDGRIDLLMCGAVLSDGGGVDLIGILRSKRPDLPAILLNQCSDNRPPSGAIGESKTICLRKSCGAHELLRAVRQSLQ